MFFVACLLMSAISLCTCSYITFFSKSLPSRLRNLPKFNSALYFLSRFISSSLLFLAAYCLTPSAVCLNSSSFCLYCSIRLASIFSKSIACSRETSALSALEASLPLSQLRAMASNLALKLSSILCFSARSLSYFSLALYSSSSYSRLIASLLRTKFLDEGVYISMRAFLS